MAIKPWATKVCAEVLARLPTIAVGDEWRDVPIDGDVVVVTRLEWLDEGWPFPMVHYRKREGAEDRDPRAGAPMFLFGKLLKRGGGERWPR